MSGETAPGYPVRCYRCLEEFDAMDSAWCSCLAVTPSLVCPHCLTCFCHASQQYKTTFWERAPAELCRRRQERRHRRFSNNGSGLPESPPDRPFILVVEDEEDVRELAGELLHELGYEVITVANGEQGLEAVARLRPNPVIADAVLPRLSGRELCLRIKSNPETGAIPVIIMSGIFTRETHKTEAMRTFKADGYLRKPVSLQELGDVCTHYLGAGHSA